MVYEFAMFGIDEIEDVFTALAKELKNAKGQRIEDLVRKEKEMKTTIEEEDLVEGGRKRSKRIDPFRDYDPNVIDFLQRCSTDEEGIEIIGYLKRKGELTDQEASQLIQQIEEKGIRSFGEKRTSGYYDRVAKRAQFRHSTDKQ